MYRQRLFRSDDLDAIMGIVSECIRDTYTPEFFLSIAQSWPKGFIVTEHQSVPIGFVMGVLYEKQQSRILLLAVLPGHRRRRLGSGLLESFMRNSSMRGTSMVTLEVRPTNTGAIQFYQRYGFEIASRIENYYNDGESGLVMCRML